MTRTELKNKIPHGYGKLIAQKAGVTELSVSRFLKGKTNSVRIEMAALELIAELSQRKDGFIQQIK